MSGYNEITKGGIYDIFGFKIMAGGIKTKGQTIDMIIGKIFKV